MFRDNIVEEIRKNRQEHAAKFNFDIRKIVKELNKQQLDNRRKTISFPSKKPIFQKTS
ncbi:MAG: hypothetical protein JJW03_02200 [Desulfosarcina sp.]|nr:hypothetical protein [Desulfobacterales bacterium]